MRVFMRIVMLDCYNNNYAENYTFRYCKNYTVQDCCPNNYTSICMLSLLYSLCRVKLIGASIITVNYTLNDFFHGCNTTHYSAVYVPVETIITLKAAPFIIVFIWLRKTRVLPQWTHWTLHFGLLYALLKVMLNPWDNTYAEIYTLQCRNHGAGNARPLWRCKI